MDLDYSPKGIGRLVDEAIALYRSGFRTLALPAACLLVPLALLVSLVQARLSGSLFEMASESAGAAGAPEPALLLATFAVGYSLLLAATGLVLLGLLYYQSCLFQAIPSLVARRPLPVGAFLKGGWHRLGYLLAAVMVVAILTGIGYVFLFVPGLVIQVFMALVVPVTVLEEAPLGEALSRSFQLVSGSFWRVVGFLLASFTVIYALQSAFVSLSVLPQIVQQIGGGIARSPVPPLQWQVFTGLMQGLSYVISVPLQGLATFALYLDLRSRREGMDLLMRAKALTAAAA